MSFCRSSTGLVHVSCCLNLLCAFLSGFFLIFLCRCFRSIIIPIACGDTIRYPSGRLFFSLLHLGVVVDDLRASHLSSRGCHSPSGPASPLASVDTSYLLHLYTDGRCWASLFNVYATAQSLIGRSADSPARSVAAEATRRRPAHPPPRRPPSCLDESHWQISSLFVPPLARLVDGQRSALDAPCNLERRWTEVGREVRRGTNKCWRTSDD